MLPWRNCKHKDDVAERNENEHRGMENAVIIERLSELDQIMI